MKNKITTGTWSATKSLMFPRSAYFVKETCDGQLIFIVKDLTDMDKGYSATLATDDGSRDLIKDNNFPLNLNADKLSEIFCWMFDVENIMYEKNRGI